MQLYILEEAETDLSIHEQVSHQGHGLLQSVPLSRYEGLILISQLTRSGHHELSNLVIQAVERLDGCKAGHRKSWVRKKAHKNTHCTCTPVNL